ELVEHLAQVAASGRRRAVPVGRLRLAPLEQVPEPVPCRDLRDLAEAADVERALARLRHAKSMQLAGEGTRDAAVYRDDGAGGGAGRVGDEEGDRLCDVPCGHLPAEQRPCGVERLELVDGDAVRLGALAPHLLRPEPRAAEDRVRVDGVRT